MGKGDNAGKAWGKPLKAKKAVIVYATEKIAFKGFAKKG
jgi:hypothetical protein